nr:zf-HC2 domain-containing protein [Streptomyces sp. TML10]
MEDSGLPLPDLTDLGDLAPVPLDLSHDVLKSLLGAWALAACSAAETAAVEEHLGGCGTCADEARRLREAVGLLHQPESLDLDPGLRTRVLEGCLDRRPPRIPVPGWATPYDAETARLDALLQDFGDAERTVSFTGSHAGGLPVSYGEFTLPLHDAMLDRAFECWVHAEDIADAVDYPYDPPAPRHLNKMIDLAVRLLPTALAGRRRAGLSGPARRTPHLVPAGAPGRSLRLEIEGAAGGEWLIPLDSPAAVGSADFEVAHVALDGVEFCRLAAGHVPPEEAAAGQVGDRDAIRDVLFAVAGLSRM